MLIQHSIHETVSLSNPHVPRGRAHIPMLKIDQPITLGTDEIDTAWRLYSKRFEPLAAQALQRHVMYQHEFHYLCQDTSVQKWRAFDETDELRAFATFTNILTAMPLISPQYFAARWPKQYAENRIWYCGFVCVADNAPMRTFLMLIQRMFRQGLGTDGQGVIALDYCTANSPLADAVRRQLTNFAIESGFESFEAAERDRQGYWTYGPAPVVKL